MQILDNHFADLKNTGCVLAFGNFDGVHKGHAHLLCCAYEYAKKNNLKFGIYTFLDSPKFKNANRSVITTLQMQLKAFEECHADFVYLEKFDEVKDYLPHDFVKYFVDKFGCECAFCGDNFTYGRGASGTAGTLYDSMRSLDKECVIVAGLSVDGIIVSSTRIRQLICRGDVEKAAELLGKPFEFSSSVVHGAHLGHTLGFPTVNQLVPDELVVPSYGVYATLVTIEDNAYMGVTNFGVKPTVSNDETSPVAETYIIGFDGDAYGQTVKVAFCRKLRDEKKFSSLDELKKSISENVEETKSFFEEKYEKN